MICFRLVTVHCYLRFYFTPPFYLELSARKSMSISQLDLGGDETIIPSVENSPDLGMSGHLEVTGCIKLVRCHFIHMSHTSTNVYIHGQVMFRFYCNSSKID